MTIERAGERIELADVLVDASEGVSNISDNFIDLAVGDTIAATERGSIEFSLDGYSRLGLSPGSTMRVADAGEGFLVYENVAGTVEYDFDHRSDAEFAYTVEGKTSYATIRGTTLTVESLDDRDIYHLVEGSIDIYDASLDRTLSLSAGETYIAYVDAGAADADDTDNPSQSGRSGDDSDEDDEDDENESDTAYEYTVTQIPNNKRNMPTNRENISTCAPYGDLLADSEFCAYVTALRQADVIRVHDAFEPDRDITRSELLKIVVEASISSEETITYDADFTYDDIDPDMWWAAYVSTAKRLGHISAENENFRPNDAITRAEAIKIVLNFS